MFERITQLGRLHLVAGIALLVLVGLQCRNMGSGEQSRSTLVGKMVPDAMLKFPQEQDLSEAERFARTDHVALLKLGLARLNENIRNYTCVLSKQERLGGKLRKEQQMAVKFKEDPFSVVMVWKKNPTKAKKVVYVEGQNGGKMQVNPAGLAGLILPRVARDPRSPEVLANSHRSVDQFGFARSIESMLKVYAMAKEKGELHAGFLGSSLVDGRPCYQIVRQVPRRPYYPFGKLIIHIDKEYLIPVATFAYNWNGQLLGKYVFSQVKFNQDLPQKLFTPQANGF